MSLCTDPHCLGCTMQRLQRKGLSRDEAGKIALRQVTESYIPRRPWYERLVLRFFRRSEA